MGLIASGLHRTAVGMLRNMLTLVDTYGFVPNGSRTYYTNRRQGGWAVDAFINQYRW